jgi:hypothetical protein
LKGIGAYELVDILNYSALIITIQAFCPSYYHPKIPKFVKVPE